MIHDIGHRRELLVDDYLIDAARTTTREALHHPVRRERVLTNDAPWEADGWVYYTVLRDGDLFRMYYLCFPMYDEKRIKHDPAFHHVCYAESRDGVNWEKPRLGICEIDGKRENNVVAITDTMDAFHVFIDKNPACPPGERYKAVYTKPGRQLWCMTSADGIHFSEGWMLTDRGCFDSHNTAFWDERLQTYVCYARDFHAAADGERIRDIRRMESPDFRHWSEPERIRYLDSPYDFHMYTNGIQPYFRAPHLYVALPARYTERRAWTANYDRLCGAEHRRWLMQLHPRYGLAVTDGLFMSFRDGRNFRRWNEAFLRPGAESPKRWIYGDCYASYGLLPTATGVEGEAPELSFYASANDWSGTPVQVFRYTLRMDGFVSQGADYAGGTMVTQPLRFDGDALTLNFATSAAGSLRVLLEDEGGTPIAGYDSGELFGDSIDRVVDFERPLAALRGMPVRMRVEMRDAELYAFAFPIRQGR